MGKKEYFDGEKKVKFLIKGIKTKKEILNVFEETYNFPFYNNLFEKIKNKEQLNLKEKECVDVCIKKIIKRKKWNIEKDKDKIDADLFKSLKFYSEEGYKGSSLY